MIAILVEALGLRHQNVEGYLTAPQAMETNLVKQAKLLRKIVKGGVALGTRNVVHVTLKKIAKMTVKMTGKSHRKTVNAETEHGLQLLTAQWTDTATSVKMTEKMTEKNG
tara:strand:- start:1410 stop:1739 length:330 start_codon:yes stop_codon:yes gene_type:complete